MSGRTTWWAKDAAWHRRERMVVLGEEFGPAGPMVMDVLSGWSQEQRQAGHVVGGWRTLAREAFVTVCSAESIVSRASEIGALDDLEVDGDGLRFSCRISGWAADAERGRAALRMAKSRAVTEDSDPQGVSDSPEQSVTSSVELRPVTPSPLPDQTKEENNNHVKLVFEEWKTATGKQRSVLDEKRQRLIRKAVMSHGLDDVLDAVKGWRHSPHHCGENDARKPYNDLELLLRDAGKIESFRDLERGAVVDDTAAFIARLNGTAPRGAA